MRKLFLILMLIAIPTLSTAGNEPPEWPWTGVTVDSLSSSPADLIRIHDELEMDVVRLSIRAQRYAKRNQVSQEQAWIDTLNLAQPDA